MMSTDSLTAVALRDARELAEGTILRTLQDLTDKTGLSVRHVQVYYVIEDRDGQPQQFAASVRIDLTV